ncbi:uncharacterized protein LOC134283558 isoform X2 [Saccostrea cucullata]|uniref:uncharacterized protein LOC134283558 isoform X2 n=1 Tax=Saccostrea cuccullata TaxID=36930 RepID=UPI002ECFC524
MQKKDMDGSEKDNVQDSHDTVCTSNLYEKTTEKSSNFLNNIWVKRTYEDKDVTENNDEVLKNNLKEAEFFENYSLQPREDSESVQNFAQPAIDSSTLYPGKEESHNSLSVGEGDDFSDDEGDATDYFDSDDEYQVSCNRRLMKEADSEFVHGGFDRYGSTPTEGRYSQGVEQYMNMPVFLKSIRKFATDNHFELWNGKPDGSCMFRSITDQLTINGHFGHTAETLRQMTVQYLMDHPLQEDGCPIKSFLSTETWEEYLTRISNLMEWSDHIMLKAIVDALHLEAVVFNIYKDDVRRTEVKSSRKDVSFPALTIYLGHLGEFHYVSLRPKKWEKLWPYRALLHRTHFCANRSVPHGISEKFERFQKFGIIGSIMEPGLEEFFLSLSTGTISLDTTDGDDQENSARSFHQEKSYISMFNSYGLEELQDEDTDDSLECLIEDPLYVDALTGIPLPHLGFIIKNSFPKELIEEYSNVGGARKNEKQLFHCIGTFATGDNVALKDISQEREIIRYQCSFVRKGPSVVAAHVSNDIQFETTGHGSGDIKSVLHADCSGTHPGYCWLRPLDTRTSFTTKKVSELNDGLFLTKQELPVGITPPTYTRQCFFGFVCKTFPTVAREWVQRKRKFDWPPPFIISKIVSQGNEEKGNEYKNKFEDYFSGQRRDARRLWY